MWLDRHIQWNGAIYQEDWTNAQINVGANDVISYSVILNGGNYRVRGVETSGVARVTTGLTIEASAAWNHSELVKQAPFLWRDGTPIDFNSLPISSEGQKLSNPGGALGSPLAGAPPFQGNIRARYEFPFNGYNTSLRSTRCISHTPSPQPIGFRSTCRATRLLMNYPLSQHMMRRLVSERTRGSCKHTETI